jgi:hypothetical protein
MMPVVTNVEEKPGLDQAAHTFHWQLRAVLRAGHSADRVGSPPRGGAARPVRSIHPPRQSAEMLQPLRGYALAIHQWIGQIGTFARWSGLFAWQLTRFSFDLLRFLEFITSERGDCN